MITESESGLTTAQYNLLAAATSNETFQFIAHKWNPEFTLNHSASHSNAGVDFDAVEHDGKLYRVAGTVVEKFDGSWSTVTGFTSPSGLLAYSLISDDDLFVFALSSGAIRQNVYDGSSWSGWDVVHEDDNIVFMAAVTVERIHYVTRDFTLNIYNLRCFENGFQIDSDIHYSYPITSFDAAFYDGRDVIAMTAEVPGMITSKYINNHVVKYIYRAGGVVTFLYRNETWSDHFPIDVVDELTVWRYRRNVRLSVVSGRMIMTCYSSDGTQVSPVAFYRIYTSKNGKHWSGGSAMHLHSSSGASGFILILMGDYLYALERAKVYRALSTLQFGNSPAANQFDFTKEIGSASLSQSADMRQLKLTLDNTLDWVSGSPLNGLGAAVIQIKTGAWVGSPKEKVMIQIALIDVDNVDFSKALTDRTVSITGRDYLAWMSSRSMAEQFKNWMPQLTIGDNYEDRSNTGYGGLGHTASVSGTWKTANSQLFLESNNREGIALSTHTIDMWNGTHQGGFALSGQFGSTSEYAGLIFRAQDKDNYWSFIYSIGDDSLALIEVVANVPSIAWKNTGVGWSAAPTARRWLRVEFYYSTIRTLISTDGKTWTHYQTEIVAGKQNTVITPDLIAVAGDQFSQHGSVGFIAKGYSPTDTWINYPINPIIPAPLPITPILDANEDTIPSKFFATGYNTKAARASSFSLTTGPDWEDVSAGLSGYCMWAASDPFNYFRRCILTSDGVYKCDNLWAGSINWTLGANNATVFGDSGRVGHKIIMSHNREGWMMCLSGKTGVSVSFDSGITWQQSSLDGGTPSWGTSSVLSYGEFGNAHISGFNDFSNGVLWGIYGNAGQALVKSIDWGLTWTFVVNPPFPGIGNFCVPYKRVGGADNIADASQLLYYWNAESNQTHFYRSTNAGATWTSFGPGAYSNSHMFPLRGAQNGVNAYTRDGGFLLAPRPRNPSTMSKSVDGGNFTIGATLDAVSQSMWNINGFPSNPNFGIVFSPGRTSYGATDGLCYITLDGGTSLIPSTPSFFTNGFTTYAEADLTDYL